MTSAFEESDVLRIKEAIEMKMKKEMDRYRVEIPPSEGKLLTLLKTETLLAKMEFLEDKFVYDCAGYILLIHRQCAIKEIFSGRRRK